MVITGSLILLAVSMVELDSTLLSCTKSADLILTKRLAIQSEFRKRTNHVLEELNQHHADTIQQLTEQHETFRTQLQRRLNHENQELEKFMIEMKDNLRLLEQLTDQIENLTHPLTEVPDVSIANTDDVIAAIKQQIPTFDMTFQLKRFVFQPYPETVSLGRIAEELYDVKIEETLVTDASRSPTTSYQEPELLWSVDCDINRHLDFLPNGDLITSNGALGIRVYDHRSGRQINHAISKTCEGYIADISVNTAKSTVAILHSEECGRPDNIIVVQTDSITRQVHPVCKGASSVAITQSGEYIVGDIQCMMYTYNSNGRQIRKKKQSGFMYGITVDHRDRIIACIRCKVVIFDQDGEKMFGFPTPSDQRKLDPRGICVDSKDNILVAELCGSVLLYDSKGNFIRTIMHINGEAMAVGLYKDKYIGLVVRHEDSSIKLCMYEISL